MPHPRLTLVSKTRAPQRFCLWAFACAALAGCPGRSTSPGLPAADAAADGEAPLPDAIERVVTLVLAAPDLPPQFVCLGAFETDGAGLPHGDPVIAGGPFGVPDPGDPNRTRLLSGFPYGAVVRLPVRHRDARFYDGLLPVGYLVDDVSPREFAGAGNDSEVCKRAWASARDVPTRQLALADLGIGDSWIAGVSGCRPASTDAACLGAARWQLDASSLDIAPATPFAGTGDRELTIQVANFSAFAQFQDVDFYLQRMRPEGDATVPDGAPVPLANDPGLSQGQISTRAIGVRLVAANLEHTLLLVVPHANSPSCLGGDTCATVAIPIQPSLSRYASPMGGATGADWAGHQIFALFGRPPYAGEVPAAVLRLGVFSADLPR